VVGAKGRALNHVKAWRHIQEDVKRLAEESQNVGRAITPQQKERLFEIAASKEEWTMAYSAALIAANTTMRGCELKALRWKDVNPLEKCVSVPDSKTAAGLRRIPLNAMIRFRTLLDRAQQLGTARQDCYVFPACENHGIDGSRPQKTWRTAWRKLTSNADLVGLRFHDMRHLCITELAERGAPDQMIMALAGHVSRRMLEYYSHIRMDAKRDAVESLLSNRSQQTDKSSASKPS
jgi:integrase